jgi:MFS transporter, FLVCR family, feline leukemia virus subgroup C receptor-related protein
MADQAPDSPAPRRWLVLTAFLGALILTQIFWYNFAPLISLLTARYSISALTASWTILVFPLASMLFSGYAGALIDRRGYRFAIQWGLVLMAVSAGVRIFDGFYMLLAGQIGIALSVPLIVTSISTLVADWFLPAEEGLFTGICTIGIFVGMALSLAASPLLVEWLGFRGAMALLAAVAGGWALLYRFTAPENRPARAVSPSVKPAGTPVRALLMNRNLAVIFVTAFIGQGCFNALTTWLEVIWHERGFSSDAAGMAGGMIIAGGIVGALLIPPLFDKFDYPRLLLWVCLAPSLLLVHPFVSAASPHAGYALGAVLGFLWLPSLAITLTVIERVAGKEHAGAASGIFWTIGNAGVLGLTVCFEVLKEAAGWRASINVLVLLLAAMNLLIGLLRIPARQAQG